MTIASIFTNLWSKIPSLKLSFWQFSDKVAPVLLVLLSLALYLPGFFSIPPTDRDESRYAQASKQMLETGDFVDIRFQAGPLHKKPAGINWLQSIVVVVSGSGSDSPIWLYRIPSLFGAILGVLLVYWCARAFTNPKNSLIAGALVASALILSAEARIAKHDAFLFACIMATQGALVRLWLVEKFKDSKFYAFIFWTGFAASILIKGPVGPMTIGLTILFLCVLNRQIFWLKRLYLFYGVIYCLAITLPWMIAIYIQTNGAFFHESIVIDVVQKLDQGVESHGAPPLTHLGVMFVTYWPLFPFVVMAIPAIVKNWRADWAKYMFAWFIPNWIVYELVVTKLPHYTLPIMPALAILSVIALSSQQNIWQIGKWIGGVLLLIVPLLFLVFAIVAPLYYGESHSITGITFCVLAIFVTFLTARLFIKTPNPLSGAIPAVMSSVFLYIAVCGFIFPNFLTIWISPRLTATISKISSCPDPAIASVGFNEPSLIFLTKTDTLLTNVDQASIWIQEVGCKIAIVEEQYLARFQELNQNSGLEFESKAVVTGLNINGGDLLNLHLIQAKEN